VSTAVTVGIDIGTTSVKAIAADGDGNVVASARVPHPLLINAPEELEHDIEAAWRDGVRNAYADVTKNVDVIAANVAAMVPSLGALTAAGRAAGPGLL
jgi:xylulokinase